MFALIAVGVLVAIVGLYALSSGIYGFLQNKVEGESLFGLFAMAVALLGIAIGFFAIGTHGFDPAYTNPTPQVQK